MWESRVLAKLRRDEPVLCAKQNVTNAWVTEIAGLVGFDCMWLCMEHCTGDYAAVEHSIRAAKLHSMDAMVRVSKAGYSDMIRPLELDAAGVMYPHCMSPQEAAQAVWTLKFHPIGRRPIDGGNIDGDFCTLPLAEYVARSNEQKFLAVQIEDKEAVEHIEAIAATAGIDIVFIGPGDLSHSLGVPGQAEHPLIGEAIERVEAACQRHGKHWGLPVSSATIRAYYDRGARFFATCADVIGLRQYFKDNLEAVRRALV